MNLRCKTGLLFLAASLAACDDDSSAPVEAPAGEVVFQFKMHGDGTGVQDFRAKTSNEAVIDAVRGQLSLPENDRNLFISGAIDRGDGGHNLAWNWHFMPNAWELAEVSIELCDGNAVLVSQDLDYWVDTVGQFCPWGSYAAFEVQAEP